MPRQRLSQRSDGRYRCKYKNKYFYGETQSEALYKREQYIREERTSPARLSNETFAGYAASWLPTAKAHVVRSSSYNNYAAIIDQASAYFGKKRLSQITSSDVRGFLAKNTGKTQCWLGRARGLIIAVFDSAVSDGICATNPAKSTTTAVKSSKDPGSHRAITAEQRQIIQSVDHTMQTFAMLMLYAGLSRSEAWGIDIDRDVDYQSCVIHVAGAVHRQVNNPVYEHRGKNKYRLRDVPLFDVLAEYLQNRHGLVCGEEKLYTYSKLLYEWKGYMKALSAAAGHPVSIRMHDLRHSFCAWCRDAGVDESMVAKWMGHTDSTMVRKVYDHISAERQKKATDLVNKSGSRGQNGGQNYQSNPEHIDP